MKLDVRTILGAKRCWLNYIISHSFIVHQYYSNMSHDPSMFYVNEIMYASYMYSVTLK